MVDVSVNRTVPLQKREGGSADGEAYPCEDIGHLGLQISGTWSGTVYFEATIDGQNWHPIMGTRGTDGQAIFTTDENELYLMSVAGYFLFRARVEIGTGNITITAKGTALSSSIPTPDYVTPIETNRDIHFTNNSVLELLLVEARIANAHLSALTGGEITAEDLE